LIHFFFLQIILFFDLPLLYNSTSSIFFVLYLILIETNFFLTTVFIGLSYLLLNLFISSITGFTWFFDWVSRIDVNDSFINSFNFFWTTFIYLPSFFFLILLINSLRSNSTITRFLLLFLLFTYLLYNIEISDFLILNLNLNTNNINITSVNLLLTNNLNKYHPFIFYLSVIILFTSLYKYINTLFNHSHFIQSYFTRVSYLSINNVLIINLLALFLGSWWALQEGTWGGWWNWDPSEVLGLLFTFTSLLYIHSQTTHLTTSLHLYRLTYSILLIIFSYLFIQLNFDLVSHNFGSKFFFFFNNNLFFLEILMLLIICYFVFYYYLQLITTQTIILNYLNLTSQSYRLDQANTAVLVLYFLITVLIINSFIPLINYFLWVYFNINSLNFIFNNALVVILVTLGLITPFSSLYVFNHLIVYAIILVSCPSSVCLLFLILTLVPYFSRWLHTFLILLCISNIMSYNVQFIYWYTLNDTTDLIFDSQLLNKTCESYSCNNHFIDKVSLFGSSSSTLFNTWNVFYSGNSSVLNNFNLLFNTNSFVNFYYLSVNWQNSILFIETNYLNNMLETIIFILITVKIWTQYIKLNFKTIQY